MVLFMFARNILEGKPIDVFNNGHQKNDCSAMYPIRPRISMIS
jgi:hypothetical protein